MSIKAQDGFMPPVAGFTLIEVTVATMLLILALAVFVLSFVQSKRSAAISDNRLDAIHDARERMETLLTYSYGASALSIGTHNFSNGYYIVSNNVAAGVKDITLTVRWVNPGGMTTSPVSLAGSLSSELHQ
jgi:type II secretory pathway pseudopilin PulG